jgi:hypothetical protein
MILALAAALAFEPFALGSKSDVRHLAAMARRCHIPARSRRGKAGYVLDLPEDVPAAPLDSPRLGCLFEQMSAHRFSAHFGTIGNAAAKTPRPPARGK